TLRRQRFTQVSALSALDGRLLAYHGFHGEPEKRLPHPR
ncbi:unnamed protein product, partial [Laminaria digitata]